MIEALVLILAIILAIDLGIGLWSLRDRPIPRYPRDPEPIPSPPDPGVNWARLEEEMSSDRTPAERSVGTATP